MTTSTTANDDTELYEIDLESIITNTDRAIKIRTPSDVELWLPRSMIVEMGAESVLVPLSFADQRGIADVIARAEASAEEFARMVGADR